MNFDEKDCSNTFEKYAPEGSMGFKESLKFMTDHVYDAFVEWAEDVAANYTFAKK